MSLMHLAWRNFVLGTRKKKEWQAPPLPLKSELSTTTTAAATTTTTAAATNNNDDDDELYKNYMYVGTEEGDGSGNRQMTDTLVQEYYRRVWKTRKIENETLRTRPQPPTP